MRWMLVVTAGLLGGCVDRLAERTAELQPLIGQPETAVVQRLGVPSRSFETAGVKYLAYDQSHLLYEGGFYSGGLAYGRFGHHYGGFGAGYGFGYPGFGPGFGPTYVDVRGCETTFQVTGGVVRSFDFRGNACG